MLKQIDILKSARQEAEQQRGQVQQLEKELGARQQQLEQMQEQHKQVLIQLDQQQRELQVRPARAAQGMLATCAAVLSCHLVLGSMACLIVMQGQTPCVCVLYLHGCSVQLIKQHLCPVQAALLSGSGQTTSAHSAAMEQMRHLAEASLKELQARIAERDGQIGKLQERLSQQQAAAVAQQHKARQELQALSEKLLDKDASSLQGLRAALSQVQVQVSSAGGLSCMLHGTGTLLCLLCNATQCACLGAGRIVIV
jgi:hypothetical protein